MLTIVRIMLAEHGTDITMRREKQPYVGILCARSVIMRLTYRDAY
jgi:hypothetical protein